MFCIKTCVVIVSDTIRPVVLPTDDSSTYVGQTATVTGYGSISDGKCVDPFNLYSTDKGLLLCSQCHVDRIEITQKQVILNPTVTLLVQFLYEPFC